MAENTVNAVAQAIQNRAASIAMLQKAIEMYTQSEAIILGNQARAMQILKDHVQDLEKRDVGDHFARLCHLLWTKGILTDELFVEMTRPPRAAEPPPAAAAVSKPTAEAPPKQAGKVGRPKRAGGKPGRARGVRS